MAIENFGNVLCLGLREHSSVPIIKDETTNRSVDIVGIGDHTIDNCPVGTVAGVAHSQHGPVCLI
ncbi:MAG: hypothetical protein AAFV88_26395, partial [Planctomycetota bacterium]